MRQPIDATLLAEIREHRLRFTCPDCLYQLPDGSCAHGWPNHEHAREPAAADRGKLLCFCKEFELGSGRGVAGEPGSRNGAGGLAADRSRTG